MNIRIYIFVLLFCTILISCKNKNDETTESFCRIENLNKYYNGISFNLNMSLDKDCYDVDEVSSGMRTIIPFWIETIEDTLLLKKHPFWGNMVSDSCLKDNDCPEQSIISAARMTRTNLKNSDYKWFVEWIDSAQIEEWSFLFPKGTEKEVFQSLQHKCLKIVIFCFEKNMSRNTVFNISTNDFGVTCSSCNE